MNITIQPDTGKGATPQMPTEPPKEVMEMVFDISKMDELFGKEAGPIITSNKQEIKEVPTDVKKEEPAKSVDAKVEEVKKEEPVKKEEAKIEPSIIKPPKEQKVDKKEEKIVEQPKKEEKKEEKKLSTLITPVKNEADAFDYSRFNQEEQYALKNMNKTAREYVVKLIDKVKKVPELENGLYLQHENAYAISPEYQTLRIKEQALRLEHKAFEDALINIRSGKPFKVPTGYDEQGNLKLSEERTAGDKDQINVEAQLANYIGQIGQVNAQVREMPGKYKQFVNEGLSNVEKERKERFAWVQDPKLLDYTVDTDTGEVPIKDIIKNFTSIWPSYLQNTPGVKVAADLFVALQIRHAELKQALNKEVKQEVKSDEAKLVEPSSDTRKIMTNGANGKNIPQTFSIEGSPLER